jgi:hypothetical protein
VTEQLLKYGVIADGSLRIAYEKGEIKERYWNPGDIFDEVHVLTQAGLGCESIRSANPDRTIC